MDNSLERIVLIPDLHCADHDPRAVDLACKLIEYLKPHRVIYLGDILDSGWASHYPQNLAEIKGIVKREKDAWYDVAAAFRSAAPDARFDAFPGNHDWRVIRGFAWAHPEFDGDEAISLPHILQVEKFDIRWHENPAAVELAGGRFIVTHGVRVRKWAGSSAHGEMFEEWGRSGASGHTHRMGQVYRTLHSGTYCWTECGHLSNRRPKYVPINKVAPPDWQQGIVTMYANSREFRAPDLIPFWYKGNRVRARYADQEFES